MNCVQLIGRLTREVELSYTQAGKAVAKFSLAVQRNYKSANGEYEADFINCVIWGDRAERLSNFTRKESRIGVTGQIATRNYENQQGQRVYVTEINVNGFDLLDSKPVDSTGTQNQYNQPPKQQNAYTGGYGDYNSVSGPVEISDDDLPF